MKIKIVLLGLLFSSIQIVSACPLCGKQQPKITRGLTHGAGPQSNWDWVIVAAVTVIALLTLVFSMKKLIQPGEKNRDHIKLSILHD